MSDVELETNTDTETTPTQPEATPEPKKYAGKFETVEQLEEGYKNSAKVYQENADLRKQLEVPVTYQRPDGLELDDNTYTEVQQLAKNANLSQEHFAKVATEWEHRNKTKKTQFEQQVKDLGEQNVNMLRDYVTKQYPEQLTETILNKLIIDKTARESAMQHREKLLNSSVPGVGKVNVAPSYTVNYEDVLSSRKKAQANPADMRLRDNYIKLTGEYARQTEAQKSHKG